MPPTRIQALEGEYPVLDSVRAPAPHPDPDAAPGDVPEGIARRTGQKVLKAVRGGATFYADRFDGHRTASGVPFRQNQLVAAHRSFPFGTILRVTNLRNGRSVNVRVVDRGPYGANRAKGAIVDLSRRAAERLGFQREGHARVEVQVLQWGDGLSS